MDREISSDSFDRSRELGEQPQPLYSSDSRGLRLNEILRVLIPSESDRETVREVLQCRKRWLEVRVPWASESIWFLFVNELAEVFVKKGIPRGRVWTPTDIRQLLRWRLSVEAILTAARMKFIFDIGIGAIEDYVETRSEDRTGENEKILPCLACRRTRFWRSAYGILICTACHPPPSPHLVDEWVDSDQQQHKAKD